MYSKFIIFIFRVKKMPKVTKTKKVEKATKANTTKTKMVRAKKTTKIKKTKKVEKPTQKTISIDELNQRKNFSKHNILNFEKRNKLILLIVFLFILFMLLYFYNEIISPYFKNNLVTNIEENNEQSWNILQITLGSVVTWENITWESLSETEWLVTRFYDTINKQQFDELENYVDSYMKKTTTFKTYYNVDRLKLFLSKLNENMIYISDLNELVMNPEKSWIVDINYKLQYKIIWNDTTFLEDWTATIVKIAWEYKIWKIMCNTTWCSKMPFFNFKRHGIQ